MSIDIFKILALCLVTAVICIVLRQKNSEYALLVSVAAGVFIGLIIIKSISAPIRALQEQLSDYNIKTEYFKVALKSVGIGYITSFIADACRDSGQTSLAAKAELAGKCAIFLLSFPLIMTVLETAIGFIK